MAQPMNCASLRSVIVWDKRQIGIVFPLGEVDEARYGPVVGRSASESVYLVPATIDRELGAPFPIDPYLDNVAAWLNVKTRRLATTQPADFLAIHEDLVPTPGVLIARCGTSYLHGRHKRNATPTQ